MKEREETLILVVDDDENAGACLQCVLREHGYRAVLGRNGANAVEMARILNPDLVLLNLLMPVKDGCSAFREIRKNPKTASIKVIMYSSMPHTEDRLLWADAFFETPFSYEELLETVGQLLSETTSR